MICCMMTQYWRSKIWQCFQRKMRLNSERCNLCGWRALTGLLTLFPYTMTEAFLMSSRQVPAALAVAQHCADMQWLSLAKSLLTEEVKQSWEVELEPQKGKMVPKHASSVSTLDIFRNVMWILTRSPINLFFSFYVRLDFKQAMKSCCLHTGY